MSVKVMSKVWEWSKASATDRLVLLAIADFTDDDGYCYPGIKRIAKKCLVHERTVQRSISNLEGLKELQVFEGEGKKTQTGNTNLFRVIITGGNTPPGGNLSFEGVAQVSPKSSSERKTLTVSKEASPEARSYIERFVLRIPATMIPKGSQAAAKWEKCYDDMILLDKRNPEEIEKVTWWALDDEFWKDNFMSPLKLRKKNKDGVCYFDVFKTQMLKPKRNGYHKPSVEALPEIGEDYVAQ
jgi:hypothetical protein